MDTSRFSAGCQELVYTLFYPGVLASMLYDFYQLVTGGEVYRRSAVMVLIALVYLLDYFHVFVDLKEMKRFLPAYHSLDLLIAALFGLSFAYAKVDNLTKCQGSIVLIVLLMLVYSLLESYEHKLTWNEYLKARWVYPVLTGLGIVQMLLSRWALLEAYLSGVCVLYVAHIFLIWRFDPARRPA